MASRSALTFADKDPNNYTPQDWVEFLKIAESLGGSSALEKHLDSPTKASPGIKADWPYHAGATMTFKVVNSAYVEVTVVTDEKPPHEGVGHTICSSNPPVEKVGGTLYWKEGLVGTMRLEVHVNVTEKIIVAGWRVNGMLVASFESEKITPKEWGCGGDFTWLLA
ncbi:hypothetical protein GP486_005833 [Trichoglossum hirsutum]|uniref:Uncharacterized protein n=1 Tax=Trichoglossum hirsutum TaxID=265104 RepID=A0A9P8L8H8_9PEZI|nr:hypothetical protein GP486_005833 [Trichoglossum hirsutum]